MEVGTQIDLTNLHGLAGLDDFESLALSVLLGILQNDGLALLKGR